MAVFENLEPKSVFGFFEQMASIPHGSGNTKMVSDWLVSFAKERGLEYYQDKMNNVIIIKEATPGYEAADPVIIQGHMDMVCQQAPGCTKNMDKEGLDLVVDGDTILARDTTLGGDDGIAVAMGLAVLDAKQLQHPRVECVFTVDEEIGLHGAVGIDTAPLKAHRFINIDSEEEGILTVSCSGGNRTHCHIPVKRTDFAGKALTITVDGLQGGHSGMEIDQGRGNSNKIMGRVLCGLAEKTQMRIIDVTGGQKENAIPNVTVAHVVVSDEAAAKAYCSQLDEVLKKEYVVTDPGIQITVSDAEAAVCMDQDSTSKTICLLTCLPWGVQVMSADIEGLVQTSLNMGVVSTADTELYISYSIRSSLESQKAMMVQQIATLVKQLGGSIDISGDYTGWEYNQESPLRDLMVEVFTEQYGHEPKIQAIHAGLECGIFTGKMENLDCVSIGPDLRYVHTFRECMSIGSVQRTWKLLTEALRRMK